MNDSLPQEQREALDFIRREMRRRNPRPWNFTKELNAILKKAKRKGHRVDGLMLA